MFRLAVDPGLHHCGVALMRDNVIVGTRLYTPERDVMSPMGARCLDIARQITGEPGTSMSIVELIFEWPQIYTEEKSKGNPNNLPPLVGIGQAVAGILYERKALIGDPVTPMPAQWIGQVPKQCALCKRTPGKKVCKVCHGSAWATPRGRMIRENLTGAELPLVPDQNDVIDAVGIALWRAGRLKPKYPGLVTG